MGKIPALALAFLLASAPLSRAQTAWPSPGGGMINGVVCAYLNSSGQAIPCSSSQPLPVTMAASASQTYGFTSTTPTVQNASYSAGQSLGGLQTVNIGLKFGTLQQFKMFSKGGSVVGTWVYIWQKSPANTTCTDKTNFAVSAADNANLVVAPFQVIPNLASPANDVTTYASQGALAAPFINADTTQGTNLYVCLLSTGTVTPATTSDLTFNLQALQ